MSEFSVKPKWILIGLVIGLALALLIVFDFQQQKMADVQVYEEIENVNTNYLTAQELSTQFNCWCQRFCESKEFEICNSSDYGISQFIAQMNRIGDFWTFKFGCMSLARYDYEYETVEGVDVLVNKIKLSDEQYKSFTASNFEIKRGYCKG